jgi:hypothetical protein
VTGDFYVYIHLRRDNGQPFYVGKGFGDRANQRSGRTRAWRKVFQEAGGFDVQFFAEGLNDGAARRLEAQKIAELEHLIVNSRDADRRPLIRRPRKSMVVTLDPELVKWLHEWRLSQPAKVPLGRALDACMRAFIEVRRT